MEHFPYPIWRTIRLCCKTAIVPDLKSLIAWLGRHFSCACGSAVKGILMTVETRPAISENAASAIAYFTFIPAAVFLLMRPYKESQSVRFHAWQSILLCMVAFGV